MTRMYHSVFMEGLILLWKSDLCIQCKISYNSLNKNVCSRGIYNSYFKKSSGNAAIRTRKFYISRLSDGTTSVDRNLVINIIDLNDEVPNFSESSYSFPVIESASVGKITQQLESVITKMVIIPTISLIFC